MKDVLINNKNIYNVELNFIRIFSIISKITAVLFFIGIFQNKPTLYIKFNFVVKFILGLFLIYRFNSYRKYKITFTELDRKVCYSAGIYIILISLGDYILSFSYKIRQQFIQPFTQPIINYFNNYFDTEKEKYNNKISY